MHYLDDYILFAPTHELCQRYSKLFIQICDFLHIPLAPHKITKPATDTTFLGITIDTVLAQARLPLPKIRQYAADIKYLNTLPELTVKGIQSILGKLNFATAVVPGRVFLRRIIELLPKSSTWKGPIKISSEARLDFNMWVLFLESYNGVTFFRMLKQLDSRSLNFQADASKMGFGATYGTSWVQAKYPPSWQKLNIAVLEFFPIFVLVSLFADKIQNSVVIFHSDNEAVCYIIRRLTSKDCFIQYFLRKLLMLLIRYNVDLRAQHVPGIKNTLCDAISRFQVTPALLTAHNMDPGPTTVPDELLPDNFDVSDIASSTTV